MSNRQEKEAYLTLVDNEIFRLGKHASGLQDQVKTLKAKNQNSAHIIDLLFPTLCSRLTLTRLRKDLRIELEMLPGTSDR